MRTTRAFWGRVARRWLLGALCLPALAWAADPQIAAFTDNPDPVPGGGVVEYTVRVDNNAVDAATNTRLSFSIPTGAAFVSASPAQANCVQQSATVVQCDLGTVSGLGADVRNILLRWRALNAGPSTLSATAQLTADNDVNNGNNTQVQTTSVISGANLSLTKTDSPDPVVGGATITYTLVASNAGPNAAGAMVVTDTLPPSVSFTAASGSGWTCGHAAGVVTCSRSDALAVGASTPPITLTGVVNASGGTVTNSATVAPGTGAPADPDTADNTVTASTTVLPGADVRMAQKTVSSPVPATAGANVTFVLQPRNGGPAAATNVVVSDPLPAGWTFVSASGPNWSCSHSAGTVSCTRATLPAGATDDITLVATAPGNAGVAEAGQTFTNTATITASSSDPNGSNNSASVNVPVLRDGADLRLSKSKTPNPVALGSDMTSTLVVTNNGPRTATGPLRVVELLVGESFISASGSAWVCTPSGSQVVCEHPNAAGLAVGASLPTLTLITRATSAGTVSNTACTGSSVPAGLNPSLALPPVEGDPNTTNDCAGASANSTTVQPDLAITKATSTPSGGDKTVSAAEASVTYTLVVSNVSLSPQAATGVRIVDTVPGFINGRSSFATISAVVSGGSSATFSCSNSNATVTCIQSGGALLTGESVTVTITVNRPLQNGSFTNTATVSNTAEGDPNASNNSASDTVTVEPIADVEMTGKSVTPGTVRAGEPATYVLSFRNNGPSTAAGVTVSDRFTFPASAPADAGVTVVELVSSKPGSSCNIAQGAVLTAAADSFSCTIGSMANGETQTVTLRVRPNWQAGNAARVFTNLARVATTTPESPSGGDNGNNERNATLNVSPAELDLLVNKTDSVGGTAFDPVPYNAGSTFLHYQVAVTNNGPSFGTGVRITENMVPPTGKRVRLVCDTTTFGGSTCNAPSLCTASNVTSAPGTALPAFSCQVPAGTTATGAGIGELASGATKNIWLRFEALDLPVPTGDIYNNSATVSANEPDTQAANDTESEQTTTRQRVDLRTTKTASVTNPTLMQPFDWVVTVVNNGPGNSLQTDLTDVLPAGVQVLGPINWTRSLQAANGSCSLAGSTVSCALGQLDATGTATITIPVRVSTFPTGGTLSNSATVDTDPAKTGGIDTPGGNNTGVSVVTVQRSSLSGTVFEDRDRSGANAGTPQLPGVEPRIAGVTLRLQGTDAYGNPVDRSVTSDASGNYVFNNLPPSNGSGYSVTETQPTGFDNSPAPAPGGSAGGSYGAGGSNGNSSWTGVVLGASVNATGYDFPELRRPSLQGHVYVDVNANGVRNSGTDLPVPGATVRLLDAGTGALIATTTTDANGAYAFTNLDPLRSVTLEQPLPTNPANLSNGPVNPGLVGGAACAGCAAAPNTPAAGTDRITAIDLSSGANGTEFNFGEVQLASIAGTVWVDNNRNGVLDTSETTRLPGVTLRLVEGADCASGTVLQTTTTAADGTWRFDGVRAYRNYLVCQTQPAGYGDGTAAGVPGNVATVNNLPPGGSLTNLFGETLATLAGSVYQDTGTGSPALFNNGQRDAGEPGVAGVPVTLTGIDLFGNTVNRSTATDANGDYSFGDLFPANASGYTVTEGAIPSSSGSFLDGRETAGTAGGNTATNDIIGGIALAPGQQASGYLFGELPVAAISGTVYIDRNRNNVADGSPTDAPLPGVTLRLVQGASCAAGTVLQTTTSGADGSWRFDNLAAGGSYRVCQVQPLAYANGAETPGNGATAGAANEIVVTSLPVGGSSGNHFGERAASLAGAVFVDLSPGTPANTDNGQRDAGEAGIAGVPMTLSGRDINGNLVSASTTTAADGSWVFDNLPASDASGYTVSEGAIPPSSGIFNDGRERAGTAGGSTAVNDSIGAISLGAGVQATGYTFGELPIAPISGTVYLDRNRNGAIDAEPSDGRLAGVTITLVLGTNCSGPVVASTVTGAAGEYMFSGVSVGLTYTLCQTQPVGYADGGVNPGAGASSGAANSITLTNLAATGSAGNHFGERAGSLAGAVYLDADNNGARQAGEAGIGSVVVTLTGTDAAGNAVSRTATSDASGAWRFDDLLAAGPGGYTVTEQAAQPVVGGVTTLDGRNAVGSAGGTASAVGAGPSRVSGIALGAGSDGSGYLFGEILPSTMSGTVFIDLNNNGLLDLPADTGLPGVTLVLTGTDDTGAPVSRNVITGPDGRWNLADLRPGTYTVTQPQQPAGTSNGQTLAGNSGGTATAITTLPSAVTGAVVALPGTAITGVNFAEIPNSSVIEGRVWLDSDANGSIGAGELGIAGVTIELNGTDAAGRSVNRTTTTDATGAWRFDSLSPGSYSVSQPQQPAGTVNGVTVSGSGSAGSTPGVATPVATTPSAINTISLGVGETSRDNLFGEVPSGRIGGRVYADNNNNGVPDAGEGGLGGVTITLTGTDDLGQPVNLNTVTAADGSWSFPGLRPGTYAVTEPAQPAGTVDGITRAGPLGGAATTPGSGPSRISGIVLPPGGDASGNLFGELAESPDLRVAKTLVEPRLTVGFRGTWLLTVRNVGERASTGSYTVSDRLPAGLTLAATPTGNGWSCTGAANDSSFSCTSSRAIAAGATSPDTLTAIVEVGAGTAASVSNVALVEGGGEIPARAPTDAERAAFNGNPAALPLCGSAPAHNACRAPVAVQQAAALSGAVWHDVGTSSRLLDGADRLLPGWQVEVVDIASGQIVGRATTAADGSWRVAGLMPGQPLAVRFREPASGVVFGYPVNGHTAPGSSGASCVPGAALGTVSSCVGQGADPSLTVVLAPGQELTQQSLPVDPSGVVYDSGLRQAVPGSVVTLAPTGSCAGWDPGTGLLGANLGGYRISAGQVSMTVGADGFYQFLFTPQAPARCDWGLTVTPPAGYTFVSSAIPPGPALVPTAAPGSVVTVQPQAGPPTGPVGPATLYHLIISTGSGGANVIHNHLPLDPVLPTGLSISKTGDRAAAELGDSVRYSITVTVTGGARPRQTTVVDRLPAGFTYIRGTAMVGDTRIADPAGGLGPVLAFNLGPMVGTDSLVLRYRVRVGPGATEGDGINRARAHACGSPSGCVGGNFTPQAGSVGSGEARFAVRVGGGVFGVEACFAGKVFVDCNGNHVQDAEELGIPGVRVVLSDGSTLVSDSEGKYSLCGLPPRSTVAKVDALTLPRGSRLTTSSNRNLGDAGSLWLDLKRGELHRGDFIEGSCSNTVLEQVKARRAQGEVRAPEVEKKGGPALRFDSKAHGRTPMSSPQQGTDGANQQAPKPRAPRPAPTGPATDETHVPPSQLPMNRPPPRGRDSGSAPNAEAAP